MAVVGPQSLAVGPQPPSVSLKLLSFFLPQPPTETHTAQRHASANHRQAREARRRHISWFSPPPPPQGLVNWVPSGFFRRSPPPKCLEWEKVKFTERQISMGHFWSFGSQTSTPLHLHNVPAGRQTARCQISEPAPFTPSPTGGQPTHPIHKCRIPSSKDHVRTPGSTRKSATQYPLPARACATGSAMAQSPERSLGQGSAPWAS